jgi:hypothetical protein
LAETRQSGQAQPRIEQKQRHVFGGNVELLLLVKGPDAAISDSATGSAISNYKAMKFSCQLDIIKVPVMRAVVCYRSAHQISVALPKPKALNARLVLSGKCPTK